MAKQTNPFLNFDMTSMMANFDPTKMADEFSKVAGQYKLPGFDVDAIMASQRKNIEALTAANQAAVAGMQQVAKRQAEILQTTLDEASKSLANLGKSTDAKDITAKQTELFSVAFEKALANMSELADMVAKSSGEASEVINTRIAENLDEVKALAKKLSK